MFEVKIQPTRNDKRHCSFVRVVVVSLRPHLREGKYPAVVISRKRKHHLFYCLFILSSNNTLNMEEPHDEFPACVSVANEEEEQDLHHHHHDAKQVAAPRTRSKTAQDDDDDDGEDEADEASVAAEESKLHPPYSRTNKDEDEEEEEEQKPAAKDTSLDKELLTQPHEEQEEAAAEEESRLEKGHESNEEEEEDEEEKQAEPEPKKPPLTPTEQRRARIFNRTFGKEDKKRKLRAQLEMLSSPTASSPPRKATRRDETTQNSRAAELSNIVISPVRRAALAYERVPITPVQRGGKGDDQGSSSSSSSNSPYRRSSRMRVPPLAFWKNEKIVYGPNDDPDSGIVAKNMPVPKAIVRANDATTTTLVRSPPRKKAPTVSPSPAKKAAKARRASPKKKTTPPSPKPKVASKSAQPHRGIGRKLPFAQPRASMAAASVDNSEEEEEELLEESVYSSISPRRSKRKRCPPLAYWKNETMDKRQRQGTSSREAAVSATKKGKKSPAKALTLNKKKMSTPDTRRPLRAAKATSLPMQARNRPPPPRPLDLPEYAYVTGEAAALMNLDSQQVEEMST